MKRKIKKAKKEKNIRNIVKKFELGFCGGGGGKKGLPIEL